MYFRVLTYANQASSFFFFLTTCDCGAGWVLPYECLSCHQVAAIALKQLRSVTFVTELQFWSNILESLGDALHLPRTPVF